MSQTEPLEIRNLVVHGGMYRTRQFGYGAKRNPGSGYLATLFPDEYNPLPVVNLEDVSVIIPGETVSPHGHGIPGFTMWLRIEDFWRSPSNQVGCTITKAALQAFPMGPVWASGGVYPSSMVRTGNFLDQDGRVIPNYGPVPAADRVPPASYLDDISDIAMTFSHKFEISAWLVSGETWQDTSGSDGKCVATLINKNTNDWYWAGPKDYDNRPETSSLLRHEMPKPIHMSVQLKSKNDPVLLVIMNKSQCSCDQTGNMRPVFAKNIEEYFPPVDPYIWRRFGNNKTEDPVGHQINPAKLDGKWHLVRPLYRTDGSPITWHNVEEGIDE